MNYCSQCGGRTVRRWLAAEGRERDLCAGCGLVHYRNPRVIVNCIVCWRESILMCRRAHEPAKGKWTVPSGYLECGESLQDGAVRETFEETGVRVDSRRLDLCSVANMTAIDQISVSFRTQLDGKPVVRPGPECLQAAFMSEEEIAWDQFAWLSSMGDRPRRFFQELRSGRFTIQMMTIGSAAAAFDSREYLVGAGNELSAEPARKIMGETL